jgi:hypothetical protein
MLTYLFLHSHATKGRLGRSQPQCHRKEPYLEGRAQLRYHRRRHLRGPCMVEQPHQGPCEISHSVTPKEIPIPASIYPTASLCRLQPSPGSDIHTHTHTHTHNSLNLIPPILANTQTFHQISQLNPLSAIITRLSITSMAKEEERSRSTRSGSSRLINFRRGQTVKGEPPMPSFLFAVSSLLFLQLFRFFLNTLCFFSTLLYHFSLQRDLD